MKLINLSIMPQTTWLIFITIFGLLFGSFLNVVICRIDELETIWLGRSHCPKCQHTLAWYDLVPFFSFILLKTKCRYCKKPISWQYPLVELSTSILLLVTYYHYVILGGNSFWIYLPLILTFGSFMVILVYDILTMTIPMEILVFGVITTLISYLIKSDLPLFLNGLLGSIIMSVIPITIIFLGKIITKKDVMGYGDIFLAGSLGLLLNFEKGLLAMMFSFMIGGLISAILILVKKVKLGSFQEIAFGPFLIIGTIISLLYGDKILQALMLA